MRNYYYAFIAGLPEISWDDRKPAVMVDAFREMAVEQLKQKDIDLINLFFIPADNIQVIRLLSKQDPNLDLRTLYTPEQLEEEIAYPSGALMPYLSEFIKEFKEGTLKYNLSPENVLSRMYYDALLNSSNAFIRDYAEFNLNIKNLVTAINARKYGREIASEVIGDNEFVKILKSATSGNFGLTQDYPYVDKVVALMNNINLVERERGIDMLFWNFIDEKLTYEYFSIEKVIGYLLELMIVERWSKMSSESGREVFMELVERFKKNFEFTDDFIIGN